MKSFAPKPWFAPQPVLIIGTYNKEGVANAMNAAWAGQWDMKEIMISMGNHVTTDNLKLGGEFTVAFATKKTMVASDFVGIVSAKNDPKYLAEDGNPDMEKMELIVFDPIHHGYIQLGEKVGNAFSDGKALK